MRLLTLRDLEELTGKNRHDLKKLLELVAFKKGPNRAHLYESTKALRAIYGHDGESLEAARIRQMNSAAHLNKLRAEVISKTRIPIEDAIEIVNRTFQFLAGTLKANVNKLLTVEKINEMFAEFRAACERLNGSNGTSYKASDGKPSGN
jgi:hypothetical protein